MPVPSAFPLRAELRFLDRDVFGQLKSRLWRVWTRVQDLGTRYDLFWMLPRCQNVGSAPLLNLCETYRMISCELQRIVVKKELQDSRKRFC